MPGRVNRLKKTLRIARTWLLQRSIIESSGLFDSDWYLRHYPEVAASGIDPLTHYLRSGSKQGHCPLPLFDPSWYRSQTQASASSRVDPLAHYLSIGWQAGLSPHPLFDRIWYLDRNVEVREARMNPLVHYMQYGSAENRWPHPLFDPAFYRKQQPDCKEPFSHYIGEGAARGLKPNALFDPVWYRAENPDAAEPLTHFYTKGSALGCKPTPLFDPAWYRKHSPDVAQGGAEALSHYLHFGWKEGRRTSPLFDSAWYLAQYPDVEAAAIDPLQHYLQFGSAENRMPNALFHPDWYRDQYPYSGETGLEALSHYVAYGETQDIPPIQNFQPNWYRSANEDVQTSGLGAFAHYLIFGKGERRAPRADWKSYRDARRSQVLGTGALLEQSFVAVGIVSYNNERSQLQRCIRSAKSATVFLMDNGEPSEPNDSVIKIPAQGNIGFGAAHNFLMTAAFARGAEYYIAANPDGALEPSAIQALLQMQKAVGGVAIIEALQFPEEHPKIYADDDFETPWASGACMMIPRIVYENIGGFDESLFLYCEDVDLSWRAKSAGFSVKTCPRALFYHPVSHLPPDMATTERYLRSGVVLARKWGSKSFESEMLTELERRGMNQENIPHPARFKGPRGMADFARGFSFAPVRW